jgi:hypothetical protein
MYINIDPRDMLLVWMEVLMHLNSNQSYHQWQSIFLGHFIIQSLKWLLQD